MKAKVLAVLYFIIFSLIALLFFTWPLFLHAKIFPGNKNSLGVIQYQDNPMTYKAGQVLAGYLIEDKALVLRIQPIGTYNLFTEDVLICGQPIELFSGKSNILVLTYETKAARMIDGIGCHRLLRADELKTEQK